MSNQQKPFRGTIITIALVLTTHTNHRPQPRLISSLFPLKDSLTRMPRASSVMLLSLFQVTLTEEHLTLSYY